MGAGNAKTSRSLLDPKLGVLALDSGSAGAQPPALPPLRS